MHDGLETVRMRRLRYSALILGLTLALSASNAAAERARILGPCEGCESVFEGIPDSIPHHSRIAPSREPGEPMRIDGIVRDAKGRPAAGVIVYAYQTDAKGIYPPPARATTTRHGRLRAWARTDRDGRYTFDTIRPGGYPGTSLPQHVHFHILEPGRSTYYIDDLVFTDDPRLTPAQRRAHSSGRGGVGVSTPSRNADGVWLARRDIVLGKGIVGYRD